MASFNGCRYGSICSGKRNSKEFHQNKCSLLSTPLKFDMSSKRLRRQQPPHLHMKAPGMILSKLGATSTTAQEICRPPRHYTPCMWGDTFSSFDEKKQMEMTELYAREVEELKESVRNKLLFEESSLIDKMILIDTIERLGLSYHFKKEIADQLEQIFHLKMSNTQEDEVDDLFMVSLQFRILREHGYNISCDIFKKFIDTDNGCFKEVLKSDIRGLLSLYEATFWRGHKDHILDEAVNFTTFHLEMFAAQKTSSSDDPQLLKQVAHALIQSLRRGFPRLEARHFISIYDDYDSKDQTLLKLAKLDFNLVQVLYKKELWELSSWYKKIGLVPELSYQRDRLVECYLWAISMYFEPQFSLPRSILTKISVIIMIIDDSYDYYATIEEVEAFNKALHRWSITEIDHLPDYMKLIYKILLEFWDDLDEQISKQGRSFLVKHTKEAVMQLFEAYYTEAKWFAEGYLPTYEEYKRVVECVNSTVAVMLPASIMGVSNMKAELDADDHQVVSWLLENPKTAQATTNIIRMLDDIAEETEGKMPCRLFPTSIEYYMRDYGVSKDEAIQKHREGVEDAWKDINEDCLKPTAISPKVLEIVTGLAHFMDVVNKYDHDGFNYPEKRLRYHISSMFIEPIPIS